MNYTHAQILKLTGLTPDRLRHWRKEMPGLDSRAARKGVVTFEEVALLAVLSHATDNLGIPVSMIAAHYEDLLFTFQENELLSEPNVVLWLAVDSALIAPASTPPDVDIAAMIRLGPIIQRLYADVYRSNSRQFTLALNIGDE